MINNFFSKNKLFLFGLTIAILIAFLDLLTKNLVFSFLDNIAFRDQLQYPAIKITSFLNLVKVLNSGVSFGMFRDLSGGKYIILLINFAILLALLIWLYKNRTIYLTWSIAFIIGGAIGNMIDRIKNHAVADFIDFHFFGYHWPSFNLADSAIFLGATLLLLENYFVKKPNNTKDV
jgi:signal peptidase II